MKSKLFILLAVLLFSATVFAQEEKTMYVMKNGEVVFQSAVSDVDSVIFYKPKPTQQDFVLINGVKWATRNVDAPGTFAANPEDTGMFYQWNRTKGWSATGSVTGWDSSMPTGTTWETANNVCPSGYRVPTDAEIDKLIAASSQWTTQNGVAGRIFGSGDNPLFLPAAGYRDYSNGTLYITSTNYWSSTQNNTTYAYNLNFDSGNAFKYSHYRNYGFSVRCVAD